MKKGKERKGWSEAEQFPLSTFSLYIFHILSLSLSLYPLSPINFRVFRILRRLNSAMVSDSIPNASIASSNPRDFAKKKRANRSAKLKQCKLDARREQWLSQVKNKGEGKEEVNVGKVACSAPSEHLESMRKLEIKTRDEEEIYGNGSSMHHHYSDSESLPSNSPTSHTSSVLGSNDSGANFSATSRSSSSSGRSTSSSSNGFCSGIMSDEDEGDAGDDDCLDDWEAMADALSATDNKQQEHENSTQPGVQMETSNGDFPGAHISSGNPGSGGAATQMAQANCCAWRPDDAYRPQGLPNLAKQYSFPLKSERHFGRGSVWGCKNDGSIPTACPICFEDLDCTDTSFLPCECGFTLCLFCHKRILEQDARCPGCRKHYEFEPVEGEAMLDGGSLTFRLARSCSMITRS